MSADRRSKFDSPAGLKTLPDMVGRVDDYLRGIFRTSTSSLGFGYPHLQDQLCNYNNHFHLHFVRPRRTEISINDGSS